MKKIIQNFLLSIMFVSFAGCDGGNDYTNALPEQAAAIVSLDLPRLAVRAGLEQGKGDAALHRVKQMIKSGLEGSGDWIDRIFSDPSEMGLSLNDKVYVFANDESAVTGILVKVVDSGRLESVIEALQKQQLCTALRETDGCRWTAMGKFLLAFSDDAFLLLADNKWSDPAKLVRQASSWLRQKENQGFAKKPDFQKLQEMTADISAWTSLQLLPRQVLMPLTMGWSAAFDWKQISAFSSICFEDGKVVSDIQLNIEDPLMKEWVEKKDHTLRGVKGTYLDAFPSKTPLWITANMKGQEFYSFLREIPAVRKYFDYSDLPVTLDYGRIFHAIDGDVSLAITDAMRGEFIVQAEVSQTEFLNVFTELRPVIAQTNGMISLVELGDNAYSLATVNGTLLNLRPGPKRFWFGVENGRFYFTNNEELINKRVLGLTLRDLKWGDRVPNKQMFMVAKWEGIRAFESLLQKHLLSSLHGTLSGLMDFMTIESVDGKHIHLEMIQKDLHRNLLYSLIHQ